MLTCKRPSTDRGIVTHMEFSVRAFKTSVMFLMPFGCRFNFFTNVSTALFTHSSCSLLCFHFNSVFDVVEFEPVKKFAIFDIVLCGRGFSSD